MITDPNAPPSPAPSHGARLDAVLADAGALTGEADVRVTVGLRSVKVFATIPPAPPRVIIESSPRSIEVWRRGATGDLGFKAYAPVTVEGAVANGLHSLAVATRVEAERALASARGALRRAEEVAEQAAERERRLAAVVRADLDAAGESGEPTYR